VAAGALSLIDAANGWQQVLATIHEWQTRRGRTCPGQWVVTGWGDSTVLVLAGIALTFLGLATLVNTRGQRWAGWSPMLSVLGLIPIIAMWLDDLTIGETAPTGDCDGVGLSGAAGAALDRAGWLFFAAAVLCLVSAVAFSARRRNSDYVSPPRDNAVPSSLSG
jgi:formate hydrogenlyase subunit 3/multisubunit Na+/H+ antiporter MnhD subunit